MRARSAVLVAAAVALTPSLARAHDPERAASLFREGRDAMTQKNYQVACRKFAESEREDPREGTLINLALCEEALGKLASAWQYWRQAADLARGLGDARAAYAEQQLARVGARVPQLTIRLEGDAPPDTVVQRDDVDFSSATFGVALPVEVGAHRVRAIAPGHAARDYPIELHEGEQRTLDVAPGPELPATAPSRDTTAATQATGATATEDEPAPERPHEPSRATRALAYGLGGLGVAALGTGAVFGVLALNDAGAAAGHCQGDLCDAAGASARTDEHDAATVSTIALLSGAGLLTAGAALRILTPSLDVRPFVRRRLAYLVGGVGLAATSVGLVLGARAIAQNRESAAGCSGNLCDPRGAAARRDAIAAGNASTIALAAGGALLAGGVVLWVTDRASLQRSVGLTAGAAPGGGSLGVQGTW